MPARPTTPTTPRGSLLPRGGGVYGEVPNAPKKSIMYHDDSSSCCRLRSSVPLDCMLPDFDDTDAYTTTTTTEEEQHLTKWYLQPRSLPLTTRRYTAANDARLSPRAISFRPINVLDEEEATDDDDYESTCSTAVASYATIKKPAHSLG